MANQKLNIDIVAKDKSKQALNGVQKSLGRLKDSVFNLRNAFLGLGAGLVVRNLVNTGKQLENLRVRLKFLLKDTNEGAKAFDNMTKFASKVPFSLEQIQSGAGILATVTDNANDLNKMLEITGNVAAVTGLDFRTTAEQIQRSFSAGIGAADLFREKGVRNMLGFKAGAVVSIEETVQAFEKVFGKEGRFGKSTDELAKTFEGTLSMIGDKIFNFKKVLLEAGFFEELKNQFGELDKFLVNNAEKIERIAVALGKNLAKALIGVVDISKKLIPFLKDVGRFLKGIKDTFFALPEFIQQIGIIGAVLLGKKGFVGLSIILAAIKKAEEFGEKFGEKGIKVEMKPFEHELSGNVQIAERNKLIHDTAIAIENAIEKEKLLKEEFLKTQQPIKELIHDLSIELPSAFETARDEAFGGFKEGLKEEFDVSIFDRFKKAGQDSLKALKSSIADFIMTGKISFATLKDVIIRSLVEALVGSAVTAAIKKATEIFKFQAIREGLISVFKAGVKALASVPFPLNLAAAGAVIGTGMGMVNKIKGFQSGGAVSKGQPIIVGENGAEMFVPNQTGQITQSARGTDDGGTNINFTINATDVRGVKELLIDNRATIVNVINSALNEKGKEALV
ncbi:tape measure protein [Pelagibacter phage HTVC112P]|nr:tape measure protein [Pelagibacter phage HTVC112P]